MIFFKKQTVEIWIFVTFVVYCIHYAASAIKNAISAKSEVEFSGLQSTSYIYKFRNLEIRESKAIKFLTAKISFFKIQK